MLALAEQLEAAGHAELSSRSWPETRHGALVTLPGCAGPRQPRVPTKPLRAATRREALPVRHTYSSGHTRRSRRSSNVRSTRGAGAVTWCSRSSASKCTVAHGLVLT